MKNKLLLPLSLLLVTIIVYAATPVFGEYAMVGEEDLERARKEAAYPSQTEIENAVKSYGCVKIATERQAPDCKKNRGGYWFCRGVTNAWCDSTLPEKTKEPLKSEKEKIVSGKPIDINQKPEKSLAERFNDVVIADKIRVQALEDNFKKLNREDTGSPVQSLSLIHI